MQLLTRARHTKHVAIQALLLSISYLGQFLSTHDVHYSCQVDSYLLQS